MMEPVPALPKPGNAGSPLTVALRCHPGNACGSIRSLKGQVGLLDSGILSLGFILAGHLDQLVLPPRSSPERRDHLWEHTCFEAFLSVEGTEAYHEINLSPSTAWAAYSFPRYRQDGLPVRGVEPRMTLRVRPDRLELKAFLHLGAIIPLTPGMRLRLGLTAVIEEKEGGLSYWAVRHPAGRPDFHHPCTFALELSLPEE